MSLSAWPSHLLALSVEPKYLTPFIQGAKGGRHRFSTHQFGTFASRRKKMTKHPHLLLKPQPSVGNLLEATGKIILVYRSPSVMGSGPAKVGEQSRLTVERPGVTGGCLGEDAFSRETQHKKHSCYPHFPISLRSKQCMCGLITLKTPSLLGPTIPAHKTAVMVH